MEARQVSELPSGEGWQFEPKWDGFRCLAFRTGHEVTLISKSGKDLTRFFPEVAASLADLTEASFVVDGELLIPLSSHLSFDALQMRLHPAQSRIEKLSRETPALLMLFDILADGATASLLEAPLSTRRASLEAFFSRLRKTGGLRLSPCTHRLHVWICRTGSQAAYERLGAAARRSGI